MICPRCTGAKVVDRDVGGIDAIVDCPVCGGTGQVSSKPISSKPLIAIVGEAWGDEEARLGLPFVGASGQLLDELLLEAEIDRSKCHITNVFNLQPQPTNDIKNLCCRKAESSVPMPPLAGKDLFLQDRYFPEVQRLWRELDALRPNLVIALGNTATWALFGRTGITSTRGTLFTSTNPKGLKVLPTYHPAAILRQWAWRPVAVADLMKAKRQSLFPEVRRPKRELWIEPSINHIELFYKSYVLRTKKLAFDIETPNNIFSCIGFAPSADRAIVIPFADWRKPGGNYWATPELEAKAWYWTGVYLQHAESEKVGQNTLFDINWIWQKTGFTPRNYTRDTMLKHHALNPELEKSLGFQGSIYTDEPAWKLMRGKELFTIKRGE